MAQSNPPPAYYAPQYPQYNQYGGQQTYPAYPSQPQNPQMYQYGQNQQYPQNYGYGPPPNPPVYPYVPPQQYGHSQQRVAQEDESQQFCFTSKSLRLGFVKKVYAILSVQMLVTIALMALMIFVNPIRRWVEAHRYLYLIAMGITFGLMIVIGCFTKPRRKFPLNVILLSVFTIAEAFMLGTISISKETRYVIYAAAITTAIAISISIFAFQTKIDFTYLSGSLIIMSIVLIAFGILALIMRSKIMRLVYCCIGVLVFSLFLLVDTQMMLGGNHAYSISPEDYIFAALNLYVDIVQIFMMVLGIFSNSD